MQKNIEGKVYTKCRLVENEFLGKPTVYTGEEHELPLPQEYRVLKRLHRGTGKILVFENSPCIMALLSVAFVV